jgi:transposase-like protein
MHIQVSLIVELDANGDLTTMEKQIQEAGQQAMRQALPRAVRAWEQGHRTCPHCGSEQVRLEGTVSRTVQAVFGAVRLPRRRMRCQRCQRRFCPAKQLLSDLRQGRVSPALVDAACIAGSSWPYRQAAGVLARLSGAQISAETIRLLTNHRGKELAKEQEAACEAREQASNKKEQTQPSTSTSCNRLIIGLDGGWVPNREQRGGMEGKVGVIASDQVVLREASSPPKDATYYDLEKYLRHHRHPSGRRTRFLRRRYVATFASSMVVGRLAAGAVAELGKPEQEQVVVADGAEWIKKEAQKHFPEATCILDWAHLWRTIAKAVRAVGQVREADQRWIKRQWGLLGKLLWKGEVLSAQALLQKWQEEQKGHPPIKALTAALTYLRTQRDWIGNYETWKQQGYPVGSGIIERAVAVVINRRMKRQGMSWLRKNASSVVALRVALLNDEWPLATASIP